MQQQYIPDLACHLKQTLYSNNNFLLFIVLIFCFNRLNTAQIHNSSIFKHKRVPQNWKIRTLGVFQNIMKHTNFQNVVKSLSQKTVIKIE